MNKFKNTTLAALLLALTSCSTVSYIGEEHAPTTDVDVYYAARDVKKEYKVIGHISVPVNQGDENKAKPEILDKARKVGADAVIIYGLDFTGGKDSTPFEKVDAIKYLSK